MLSQCFVTEFEIKTFRGFKYEIEVAHSKKGIFISQQKHVFYLQKNGKQPTYELILQLTQT